LHREDSGRNTSLFTLQLTDKTFFQTHNPIEIIPFLEWFIINTLIPKLPPYMAFHSAALSFHGDGILFPAVSGSGKTTLSLALLTHGFKYLSDEVAILDKKSFHLLPLPRGLIIREKAFGLLQNLNMPLPAIDFYMRFSNKRFWYLNPSPYTHRRTDGAVPAKYIIFLKKPRPAQGSFLEKVSHAMAISRLLRYSFSTDTLTEETVVNIAKLVQTAKCFILSGNTLAGRVDKVLHLLNQN
jgi:hypothetical protein